MTELVTIDDLQVDLPIEGALRPVLLGVSLRIGTGEVLGLVGESGSGKSMTARAVARLLPNRAVVRGSIMFDGRDVLALRGADLRAYRSDIAVIFQDPRAHVNPVRTIGDFLTEELRTNRGVSRKDAEKLALVLLDEVGIPDGARRLQQYPHELSGGLLQRMMIASALLSEPRLLLADEPTTALDVTTQSEVMVLLDDLRRDRGLAMLFITHNLELAGAVCDRTMVMYAGQIVEEQSSAALYEDPLHPYTAALVAARPSIEHSAERLVAIPGRPLSAFEAPAGCAFADRCPFVEERCRAARPALEAVGLGTSRCVRAGELRGRLHLSGSVLDG